jgi:surface protein
MAKMFDACSSLLSLDISNFNTQKVTDLQKMFSGCSSLTYLNLSNFDTSSVENLQQMFYNCRSLISLEISKFDTSSVTTLQQMFYYCTSLKSLNLSNFDASQITNMESMFEGCINLEYLNFKNFEFNSNLNDNNMFLYTPEDLVYCIINESNIPLELNKKECTLNDCKENWLENKQNLFENKKNNISSINDKCIFDKIKEISQDFFFSNKISNTSIYSYKLGSNINELKSKYTNLTIIDFTSDNINYIYDIFNLDKEKTNIYIIILFNIIKIKFIFCTLEGLFLNLLYFNKNKIIRFIYFI